MKLDLNLLEEEISKLEKNTISDGTFSLIEHLIYKFDKWNLDIKPNYQRIFRRTKEQKTKLIESLILWIPLPWFFVAEDVNWNREVVDWLQRIATILEFTWNQRFKEKYWDIFDFSLKDGLDSWEYLTWLEGISRDILPEKYKNRILNNKIYIWILRNTWDIKAKFELFQRINTLWSPLSPQEARNCFLTDKDDKFYEELKLMSNYPSFLSLISDIKKWEIMKEANMELALRYIALKNISLSNNTLNISLLIDNIMFSLVWEKNKIFSWVNKENEFLIFKKTFDFIWWLNAKSFNKSSKKQFIYPLFDTVSSWIWYNIWIWNIDVNNKEHKKTIKERIETIQDNDKYKEWTWTGKTSNMKLKFASIFWKDYFKI